MYWIASDRYLLDATDLTKADLQSFPIISYEIGTLNHQRLVEYFPDGFFEDNVVHYSNSLGATISMVTAGVGIAVLPPIVIQTSSDPGR